MNILHAFIFFSVKHAGGTCDLIYKLARAQARNGHNVTIYTGDYMIDYDLVSSIPEVRVEVFKSYLNGLRLYFMPDIIRESKINLKNYDVIHLHVFRSFQNIVLAHYAKKYRIPYIIDAHGAVPRHTRRRGLKWLFDKVVGFKMLITAHKCVGETKMGTAEYVAMGVADDKITVIQPPFPVEDFENLPNKGSFRKKYKIENEKIIMFLGRIHWIKGIDFLIEGFAQLLRKRQDVHLVIVGPDDDAKTELDALINNLGIGRHVLFTGYIGGREKLSALVDADVVVQTSRYEQGAWAPIEGLLCDTPIIVSDNSGAGEDVRNMDAGYLVEWGNKQDLSNKIDFVLQNPAEASSKTAKAKEYIKHNLSMTNSMAKYETLYKECLKEVGKHSKK